MHDKKEMGEEGKEGEGKGRDRRRRGVVWLVRERGKREEREGSAKREGRGK